MLSLYSYLLIFFIALVHSICEGEPASSPEHQSAMLKGRDNGRLNGETKALLSSGDAGLTNGHACANIGQNKEPGLSYAGIKDTKLAARLFCCAPVYFLLVCFGMRSRTTTQRPSENEECKYGRPITSGKLNHALRLVPLYHACGSRACRAQVVYGDDGLNAQNLYFRLH